MRPEEIIFQITVVVMTFIPQKMNPIIGEDKTTITFKTANHSVVVHIPMVLSGVSRVIIIIGHNMWDIVGDFDIMHKVLISLHPVPFILLKDLEGVVINAIGMNDDESLQVNSDKTSITIPKRYPLIPPTIKRDGVILLSQEVRNDLWIRGNSIKTTINIVDQKIINEHAQQEALRQQEFLNKIRELARLYELIQSEEFAEINDRAKHIIRDGIEELIKLERLAQEEELIEQEEFARQEAIAGLKMLSQQEAPSRSA